VELAAEAFAKAEYDIGSKCLSPYQAESSAPVGTQKRTAVSPPDESEVPIRSEAKPILPRLAIVMTPAAVLNE
jgi:hypothetical protein